jgi:hypothetical protein
MSPLGALKNPSLMTLQVSGELASSAVTYLERALGRHKAADPALARVGLAPTEVRRAVQAAQPLTREEVRRAMARQVKPGSCGRGGLPDYVVQTMYADYQRLKSLAKVGKLYGRTRQSIYCIFSERGLQLEAKKFHPKITFDGRSYTPGKNGYYRDTAMRKRGQHGQLHHAIWVKRWGPIPAGHQVFFKDGDKTNFALENLGCLPVAEVTHYHQQRLKQQGRAA